MFKINSQIFEFLKFHYSLDLVPKNYLKVIRVASF